MDVIEVALRLGAATLAGAVIGLDRDMHDKSIGVRTLGIVGLGSALVVMAMAQVGDAGAVSRVVQGIVTGIGFIGAGVIVRSQDGKEIHGLTTAACAWLTACIGVACGLATWRVVLVSLPLIFLVLLVGGPLEKSLRQYFRRPDDD